MFTEAVAAVRAGDQTRARDLFSRLLRIDSSNPEYWLWMSAVVESERERLYCLQSVLRHDPTNRAALRGLTILGAHEPDKTELSSALKIPHRKIVPPDKLQSPVLQIASNWRTMGIAAIVLAVFIVILGFLFSPRGTGVAPDLPTPSPTFTHTPVPPTITPIPPDDVLLWTPIPTELAGTPFAAFLPVTPTPTPHIGLTPRSVYEAYTSAVNSLKEEDYESALMFIEQVIGLDRNLADAFYVKGEVHRLLGELDEAETSYTEAIRLNQAMAPAYFGLGRIQTLKNPYSLPEAFSNAITHDPTFLPAYLEIAEFHAQQENWSALDEVVTAAIQAGLHTPRLQILLGQAQFHQGHYQVAYENALAGIAGDPGMLDAYLLLGQLLVERGNSETALSPLSTYILFHGDDAEAWFYLGRAASDVGNIPQAIDAFSQTLAINNFHGEATHRRGLLYLSEYRYDEALADLERAEQLGVASLDLPLQLSQAYLGLGELELAMEVLLEVIENSEEPRIIAGAYALLAYIYEILEPPQILEAIAAWQAILELAEVTDEIRAQADAEIIRLEEILNPPTPTPERAPE